MKRGKILLLLLALCTLVLSSCLTVEKKIYSFEFKGKGSGTLKIKYYNIMSIVDSAGVTEGEDFDALINDYLNGDKINSSYPDAQNIQKRLFEEDGVLCAEVSMDFTNLSAARLYQFEKGPYVFYASSVDGETYIDSNGSYGGDVCPVVMWSSKNKKLEVTTSVSKPTDDTYVSLLAQYKKWKK